MYKRDLEDVARVDEIFWPSGREDIDNIGDNKWSENGAYENHNWGNNEDTKGEPLVVLVGFDKVVKGASNG